jgi:hypothetical protein
MREVRRLGCKHVMLDIDGTVIEGLIPSRTPPAILVGQLGEENVNACTAGRSLVRNFGRSGTYHRSCLLESARPCNWTVDVTPSTGDAGTCTFSKDKSGSAWRPHKMHFQIPGFEASTGAMASISRRVYGFGAVKPEGSILSSNRSNGPFS